MGISNDADIALILSYMESPDFVGLLDPHDKELAEALVHEILGFRKPPTNDALNWALSQVARDLLRTGYLSARYYSVKLQYEDMVTQVVAEEDAAYRAAAVAAKTRVTEAGVTKGLEMVPRVQATRRNAQLAGALSGLFFQLNKAMEARARALEQISNNERQTARATSET